MTAKTSTFAGQLTHFAESVDIVDDARFDNVRDLVYRYVVNQLGGQYFERLDRTKATQRLVKRLRDLGYRVQLEEVAA